MPISIELARRCGRERRRRQQRAAHGPLHVAVTNTFALHVNVSPENLLFRTHAEASLRRRVPRERGGSSLMPRAVRPLLPEGIAPCYPGPAGDATPRSDLIQSRVTHEIEHKRLSLCCLFSWASMKFSWERRRRFLHRRARSVSFSRVSIFFPLSRRTRRMLSDFCAAFAAALLRRLALPELSAAACSRPRLFAFAAVFLRPKRLPRSGAAASSSRHNSSVTVFGSVSFGMRALRLPSVMYGP